MITTDLLHLQWKLIYAMVVAGKTAAFANEKIELLRRRLPPGLPFCSIEEHPDLRGLLKAVGTGNYSKLSRGLRELAASDLDLETCTPADLQKIHGIGPKTARFFILWTRDEAPYAALDVHVLRWLRGRGYNAPTSTPQSERAYRKLEQAFLTEASGMGLTPRALDLQIWEAAATAPNLTGDEDGNENGT